MGAVADRLATIDPNLPLNVRESRDFERFAPKLKVRVEEGKRIVPLHLMPGQRKIADAAGEHKRVLILKSRRLGITTLYLARAMHAIHTQPFYSALMTAHKDSEATKIFKAANIMEQQLPDGMRHIRTNARARIVEYPLMNSMLTVGTAAGHGVARSDALQFVHMTEVARYRGNSDETVSGMLEAARAGFVTGETTAFGSQGWFYDTWNECYGHPKAPWRCIFAPFWWDHRNVADQSDPEQADEVAAFEFTDEEREWAKDLTPAQIVWYRRKAALLRHTVFAEYPRNPTEAFQSSGLHFFDQQLVAAQATVAMNLPTIPLPSLSLPKEFTGCRDGMKVWEPPQTGAKYDIGADPTDGVPHGDFAYASVHRRDSPHAEQVARIRGRWGPTEFAGYIKPLAVLYNNAFTGVELNHRQCVRSLRKSGYRKLFRRRKADGTLHREPGFWMDQGTRTMGLDYLREALEGEGENPGWLVLRDPVLFAEMATFEDQGGGKYEANTGEHDDSIIAVLIALQVRQQPSPKARTLEY